MPGCVAGWRAGVHAHAIMCCSWLLHATASSVVLKCVVDVKAAVAVSGQCDM